jgi:hypothetical protein
MSISRRTLLSCAVSGALGLSAAAMAQDRQRESLLEEIIVTAERRAESVL